tara:strand:- start:53 stop:937 length:885 start_codon:yes stop_codon:yes gene_type:complete
MASLLDPIATEETPEDDLAAEIRQDPRYDAVRQFIIDREGWQPKGTWDVNAFRAGYGSDTITLEDGRVVSVDENMSVTREDADRDIDRRLTTEFMPRARNSISPQVYDSLDADTLAVVTSLAYNFGRIPESVVEAFNTGDKDAVADSIEGLTSSNPGLNKRRQIEADMVRNSLFMSPDAQPEEEWQGVPHVLTQGMRRTRRSRSPRSLLAGRIDPFEPSGLGGLLGSEQASEPVKSDVALLPARVKYRLSYKTVQAGDGDDWRDIQIHDTVEDAMQHLYALRSEMRRKEATAIQ